MGEYIVIFVLLVALSYAYLRIAVKYRIIDKPNLRSSHTKITVRGGGIVFPFAILLFYVLNDFQYTYLFFGVLIISVISFLDDVISLSSKIRFPFQLLSVLLILMELPFVSSQIFLFACFLILGVGVINMFNFMDGINGITGLYSLVVISSFWFMNQSEGYINDDLFICACISLIVFGFYNFRKKALFFAGDIGSTSIGLLIFFLGTVFAVKTQSTLILLLVIVYGADASMTLLYRLIFLKEDVFKPHRHHIYQKLVDVKGFSHLKVSFGYAIVQCIVNVIVFKTYKLDVLTQSITFFALVLFFILIYLQIFKSVRKTKSIE